jgi:membrane protein implicated in regulation of membrane protease activity
MPGLIELFVEHPFWAWLAIGVVLLIAETLTGSGWLLWPAVSAGLTAVVVLTGKVPQAPVQVGIFAGLTLVSTLLAKPWTSRPPRKDLNDRAQRVLGQTGEAREDFVAGRGRVFVDGCEWPAELEGGGELKTGALVRVVKVEGARLVVGRG